MPGLLKSIGVSVIGVTLTLLLTISVPPVAQKIPFALFFGLIAAVSWYCGQRTGYVTIALSCLATKYFVFSSSGFSSEVESWIQISFLALIASGINELISKLQASRDETVRQRQWLQVTLKSIGDAVIATDAKSRIVFMNPVAEKMCGWNANEAFGQPLQTVFKIINEQTREPAEDPVTKVLREGIVVGLANHTALISKAGSEIPIEDSAAPIHDGERIIGTVMVFHDVSDRRRAETAVLESEERFRFALNAGRIGVWDWDIPTNRISWTEEVYDIHGLKPGDFDGSSEGFNKLVHPEDRQRVENAIQEALKNKSKYHMEFRIVWPNGEVHWISTDGQVSTDINGNPRRMVGSMRDITVKKGYENQLKFLKESAESANRAKDEFLAVVSHELRTPLTSILGWIRMLQEPKLDALQRVRGMQVIERNARVQATLVEDLLDVSRIISGKLTLKLEDIDLRPIIDSALETVRLSANAKEITLTSKVSASPMMLRGDASRMQQVVYNLLSNAIKFTPRRGAVSITAENTGSQIDIVVTDTGIGIDSAFIPYVFDRFKQADSSTTRSYQGLGLGLAIVRHLVELHGGTVRVESQGKDMGSTFTISVPSQREKTVALPLSRDTQRKAAKTDAAVLKGMRVLVVEDETDSRELLKFILEQFGADASAAENVPEALTQFQRFKPHVLLSDIGLPEQDGYDLIRQIRALPADNGGGVPAIALTAFAKSEDRSRALSSGFQIHITKPVEPDELASVVASLRDRNTQTCRN